jgi:hypothetical protein
VNEGEVAGDGEEVGENELMFDMRYEWSAMVGEINLLWGERAVRGV